MANSAMYAVTTLREVTDRKKGPDGKVVAEELECGHWIDVRHLVPRKLARQCKQCPQPKRAFSSKGMNIFDPGPAK